MERTVAKCLLEIGSIYFCFDNEYVTKGGLSLPVYSDNRIILSYPQVRNALTKWLARHVKENYSDVEMIIGTAVNGISFATLLSNYLNLPMAYILEKNKDHGFKNRVEGVLPKHAKVLIVDDVVCTGGTLLEVNKVLQENEMNVLGAVSIFSYEFGDTNRLLHSVGINNTSLTNYDCICKIGNETGKITYDQYLQTIEFKKRFE